MDEVPAIRLDPEVFAGARLDISQETGVLTIFTTRDLTVEETLSVDGWVPSSTATEYVLVEHSLADLEALADRISDARSQLGIYSVGISLVENRVVVGLSTEASMRPGDVKLPVDIASDMTEIRSVIPEEDSACWSRTNCHTHYRGGIEADNQSGGRCTTGFAATDSSSFELMLTAGHCGDTGDQYDIGGRAAVSQVVTADSDTIHDALAVAITASQGEPRLYRRYDDKNQKIFSRADANWFANGRVVCFHSIKSFGRHCAPISDSTEDLGVFDDLFLVDVAVAGNWGCSPSSSSRPVEWLVAGTSGGAVTNPYGGIAAGLQRGCANASWNQGTNTTTMQWSGTKVRNAESALGLTVQTG